LGVGCEEIFTTTKIEPTVRPQDLTVLQWCTLAHAYEEWLKTHPEVQSHFLFSHFLCFVYEKFIGSAGSQDVSVKDEE
jgi:hypothetical protein